MFEDLKANIALLERKGDVTAEDLLDSMSRLFDGAGNPDVAVADAEAYGDALINLFDRLIPSYRKVSDRLSLLDDDDITDVVSSCEEISGKLNSIRPLLADLADKKKRRSILQTEYDNAVQQRALLQSEADQSDSVSTEDLLAVQEDVKKLKAQLADKQGPVQGKPEEYSSEFAAIKNAWDSIRSRDNLSAVLESFPDFKDLNADIASFSDLAHWFEKTEAGLEKVLSMYADMYREIVNILNKSES